MKRDSVRLWKAALNGQRHAEEHHAQCSQGRIQALETGVELSDDDLVWVYGGADPIGAVEGALIVPVDRAVATDLNSVLNGLSIL